MVGLEKKPSFYEPNLFVVEITWLIMQIWMLLSYQMF